ncbi:MAG: DUF2141 domain-containing protein [Pseudomonadota bacterium]
MKQALCFVAAASLLAAAGPAWADAAARGETAGTAADFDFEHVSCTGAANEVRVVVSGVKQSAGLIVADLYRNDPEGFLKRAGRVQQVRFAAKSPATAFCMKAPEAESYAIALYHDENANKTLDKGAFGIPKEPFGISNNPKIRFGPPSMDESLFAVAPDGANVEIKLKN